MQHYYSEMYDNYLKICENNQEDAINILSSIFSRTKLPTNTK